MRVLLSVLFAFCAHPQGTISTFAGGNRAAPLTPIDLGTAEIAADGAGNLYLDGAYRIRRLTPGGVVSNHAGTGFPGSSEVANVTWLTGDIRGNLYFYSPVARQVRRVAAEGV